MHTYVYCGSNNGGQGMEKNKVSYKGLDKEDMIYIYNGKILGHKKR